MTASRRIVVGVDTHADSHTAAVCDDVGRMVAFEQFSADRSGYRALMSWARRHGEIVGFGVEGTGSYGAGCLDT